MLYSSSPTRFVSMTNSSCVSCSGRLVKKSSSLLKLGTSCFKLTRSILRRWLNTVFTTRRNNCQSQPMEVRELRVMRITADFTFGGGLNTVSSTVNKHSVSYHACSQVQRLCAAPPHAVSCPCSRE